MASDFSSGTIGIDKSWVNGMEGSDSGFAFGTVELDVSSCVNGIVVGSPVPGRVVESGFLSDSGSVLSSGTVKLEESWIKEIVGVVDSFDNSWESPVPGRVVGRGLVSGILTGIEGLASVLASGRDGIFVSLGK